MIQTFGLAGRPVAPRSGSTSRAGHAQRTRFASADPVAIARITNTSHGWRIPSSVSGTDGGSRRTVSCGGDNRHHLLESGPDGRVTARSLPTGGQTRLQARSPQDLGGSADGNAELRD